MSNLIPVPAEEEQAFSALFSDSTYDRAEFKLELTEHPPATYGPRVKTIKIFWKDGVIAEYGAADATSWVEQFRADWDSGLVPEILGRTGDHGTDDSMTSRRIQPESVRAAFQEQTQNFLAGISDSPGELRECPDQFLGPISELADGWENAARLGVEDKPKDLPCVLLIMESPHKDEYKDAFPKPANGPTGRNIAKHLLTVKGLSQYSDYGLVLINAVQYQCSRSKPPKDHRDACFRHIWENGGRADFMDRLQAIQSPGDVLVNACTRGTRGKPLNEQLRCLVHSAVLEIAGLLDAEPYRRNHPATWGRKKNRDYEWTNYP